MERSGEPHRGAMGGHGRRADAPREPRRPRPTPRGPVLRALFLLVLLTAAIPVASAVDPFPVLLGDGQTFLIPADAQPGWLFTNAGTNLPTELRLTDTSGEIVAMVPANRSNQATHVAVPAGGQDAGEDEAGDGALKVFAQGRTWVAWVREWRYAEDGNETLYLDCPVDEHVAVLWSPPASRGVLSVEGNESGLELFVYADAPFRLLFHDEGDVDWKSGVVQAGPRAFWVVARTTGAPCGEGFELTFTEDAVIDLNAFDSLGWLIAAGIFVMLVLLWFSRPGSDNRLGPGKGARALLPVGTIMAILLLSGMGGLLATPDAEANGGMLLRHFAAGPLVRGGFQGVAVAEEGGRLCFQAADAAGAGRVQVIEDARGQDELLTLQVPPAPGRVCTHVEGGQVEFAGEAHGRWMLMPEAPRTMRTPGTQIIDGGGGTYLLEDATRHTRIGVLVASGWSVHVMDLSTFMRLGMVSDTGKTREVPLLVDGLETADSGTETETGTGAPTRTDLLVVAVNHRDDRAGDVRIQWQDPSWFALEPTLGHVLLVAAIALFVILYREGRRHHPMYGPPRP